MKKSSRLSILFFAGLMSFLFLSFSVFRNASAQQSSINAKPSPTPQPSGSAARPTVTPTPKAEATPQEDDEVIRIDTDLVNLSIRVVDRMNRPINNLTKNDFKIYENNVLQTVDSLTTSEVPTNYAIVIDNSGSLRSQLEKVIDASKVIIATNKPDDETAVIRFISSDKIEVTQDFTNKKDELEEALDNLFVEAGQTAIIDAVYLAAERVDQYEKARNSTERKRRALILVSDGEDRSSYYNEQQLFNLLRETEVQIYAVGFTSELDKEGGLISKSPKSKAEGLLKRLSEETGGKAYFPVAVSELDRIARDIASELRTQYLLSYYPSDDTKDGSFRSIRVAVADGPNKQKRIAITRTGRTTPLENKGNVPVLQKPSQTRPNN